MQNGGLRGGCGKSECLDEVTHSQSLHSWFKNGKSLTRFSPHLQVQEIMMTGRMIIMTGGNKNDWKGNYNDWKGNYNVWKGNYNDWKGNGMIMCANSHWYEQ